MRDAAEQEGFGADGPRDPVSETRLRVPIVPRDAYAAVGDPGTARTVLAMRRYRGSIETRTDGLVEAERAALTAHVADVERFTRGLYRELGLQHLIPLGEPEPAPEFDGADTLPCGPPHED